MIDDAIKKELITLRGLTTEVTLVQLLKIIKTNILELDPPKKDIENIRRKKQIR